jgi:acyl carrier protein
MQSEAMMSQELNDASSPSAIEQTIVEAWRRVLRVEHIGPDDNFFDLGGDSLQLLAVHSGLQKTLGAEIAVVDLFEFTSVRRLAAHLGNINKIDPSFSESRKQAEKQRAAFALLRQNRTGSLNESDRE